MTCMQRLFMLEPEKNLGLPLPAETGVFYNQTMMARTRVLLHICCAPDSTAVVERMAPEYQVTGYFHNPNIAPPDEYTKRLQETERVAVEMGFLLEPAPFLPEAWDEAVRGYEGEPEGGERCFHCFRHNLRATAQKARELGIERITTTLTISPHKQSAKVFAAGREAAQEFGVEFLEMDFKKQNGFKRSLELCKAMNVYRQNYCGCKYSKR